MKYTETCSTGELSYYLELSTRWVSQLAQMGILRKAGRGKFYIKESLKGYSKFKRGSAKKRAATQRSRKNVSLEGIKLDLDLSSLRDE